MRANTHHIHHHRHPGYSYPVRLGQKIYVLVVAPLFLLVVAGLVVGTHPMLGGDVNVGTLITALAASMLRLLIAYIFALVLAVPLALLINTSALTERLLLPAFDILESVPVLAFFPVVIVFFIQYHILEGAAIFIIFINMLWNIVFSLVGGLRLIPSDIKSASKVFHIRGWHYLRHVLLPAVLPYLVTGSLLAWAEGWNMLIVAEVLHTYLPGGTEKTDLYGIGSLLVHASASGQHSVFLAAIVAMVVAITVLNVAVWQRLLHYAEGFRFE